MTLAWQPSMKLANQFLLLLLYGFKHLFYEVVAQDSDDCYVDVFCNYTVQDRVLLHSETIQNVFCEVW